MGSLACVSPGAGVVKLLGDEGCRGGGVALIRVAAGEPKACVRPLWPCRCPRSGSESVGHFASVFLGAESVAAWLEMWGDAAERGPEPLRVPG